MWKNVFELLKRYKYHSVLVKTFLVVIGLEIAMMAVVNGIYIYKIEKDIYREIEESCVLEVERQKVIIDALVEQAINFSYFNTDQDNMAVFGNLTIDEELREKQTVSICASIKSFQKSFDYIESVYIYLDDLKSVITDKAIVELSKMEDIGWMEAYEEFSMEPFYMLKSRIQNDTYPYLLTVYYPVWRVYGEKRGAVIVNIDMDKLSKTLGFAFRDLRNIYMVSSDGELLVTNKTKALKNLEMIDDDVREMWENKGQQYPLFVVQESEEGEKAIVAVKSSYGNWYYWMEFSMDYYGNRFDSTRQFMLWSAVVSILAGMIVSVAVALKSYQPIRYAVGLLESDENVVEDILMDATNQSEFRRIFELTHSFPQKGAGKEAVSNRWMERLGRAQMQVLQSQITPHFLYNTLDSISWMAVDLGGGPNEVSQAIQDLSGLLRKSLNKTSYFASLGEEVEQAKLYIRIMEIQDPGKLKTRWNVAEELHSLKVVRFTLQPILENAIRHGFKHRRFKGNIEVTAEVVTDVLMIRITDDGCGMTREDCIRMNRRLSSEYEIVSEHVGIQNVNQRIKIMFGAEYGVRLVPGSEEGLCVYLAFPIMET